MLQFFVISALCISASTSMGDFETLEGARLIDLAASTAAKSHATLTVDQLVALPRVVRDSRATLIIVRTDQGNLARLLVSPALRKSRDPNGPAQPVLLVDRFETFEVPGALNRLASARDLILFDGFRLDFDIGQIVPDGQGGDIQFRSDGKRGIVEALGDSSLLTIDRLPPSSDTKTGSPSSGQTVRAADFAGSYRLIANGQWSGLLELGVDADRHVNGRFRSDQTGSSYRVVGDTGKDEPGRIELTIQFPRSQMNIEGRMWTQGKSAFSGEAHLLDRTYGFVAVRAGKSIEPNAAGIEIERWPGPAGATLNVSIDGEGTWRIDGARLDEASVAHALRKVMEQADAPVLSITADGRAPIRRVHELMRLAGELGPFEFRLANAAEGRAPAEAK